MFCGGGMGTEYSPCSVKHVCVCVCDIYNTVHY